MAVAAPTYHGVNYACVMGSSELAGSPRIWHDMMTGTGKRSVPGIRVSFGDLSGAKEAKDACPVCSTEFRQPYNTFTRPSFLCWCWQQSSCLCSSYFSCSAFIYRPPAHPLTYPYHPTYYTNSNDQSHSHTHTGELNRVSRPSSSSAPGITSPDLTPWSATLDGTKANGVDATLSRTSSAMVTAETLPARGPVA